MKIRILLTAIFLLFLAGCSNDDLKSPSQVDDEYHNAREVAWEYLKEKGWNKQAKADWKTADVSIVKLDESYEIIDRSFIGEEVLSVTFKEKENASVAPPDILISKGTNTVIGYMPGE